jgi:hypothetical protein
MTTRKGIAEALGRTAGSARIAPEASPPPKLEGAATDPESPYFRPGRQGKIHVGAYFPPEVKRQLRMIAAENDKTIQQLLGEALNGLFARYGRAEIAPTERE